MILRQEALPNERIISIKILPLRLPLIQRRPHTHTHTHYLQRRQRKDVFRVHPAKSNRIDRSLISHMSSNVASLHQTPRLSLHYFDKSPTAHITTTKYKTH